MCFFRLTLTESEEGTVHAVEAAPLLKGFGHAQGEEDDFRQEVGVGKGELPDCPDLRIVSRGDVAEGFFLAPVAEFHEAGVRDLSRNFEGLSVSGADEPAAGAPGYGDVGGQLDAGLFPADFLQELRHFLRLRGGFTEDVFRAIEEFRVFPELPGFLHIAGILLFPRFPFSFLPFSGSSSDNPRKYHRKHPPSAAGKLLW